MPKTHLTDRWLKSHRPDSREEWTDTVTPRLVVRFGAAGPVFYGRWREGAAYKRVRLGAYPGLTLQEARERMRDASEARQRGEVPKVQGQTFEALAKALVAQRRAQGMASVADLERTLRKDAFPTLGRMRPERIRAKDVAAVLDPVMARGAGVLANRLRSALSVVFAYGIERGWCEFNPAAAVRRPLRKEKARDRVLTDRELVELWRFLERRHPTMRHILRFLLLTAARTVEARLLTWENVRAEHWVIPEEVAKNRTAQTLPLSARARAVLDAQRAIGFPGPLVFPSPKNDDAPLYETALALFASRLSGSLGFKFTPHDLRRTAGTGMTSLGHPREIVQRAMSQTPQGLAAVYDRYTYEREIRAALDAWGAHVQALLLAKS